MRRAVVRVNIDPAGTLTRAAYARGLARLEALGAEMVTIPPEHMPDHDCEIEFIVSDNGLDGKVGELVQECGRVFATAPAVGVTTYISRGTDDDARGVLKGFNLDGEVVRSVSGDHEIVTVTVQRDDLSHVSEGRLHTALEAALNCEVRIECV